MTDEVIFSGHAIRQMFERRIGKDDVLAVLSSGQEIMAYPEDKPYSSRLLLGFERGRPLHVVVSVDQGPPRVQYVVTAYEPDPVLWMPGFRARRPS